jgi:EAL domain-containing protein (putative c-di-GMP-specific phosphodiesterase class I)
MRNINKIDLMPDDESPFANAVARQKTGAIALVKHALLGGRATLAFQPVMAALNPRKTVFYEGLIRVPDENGRIIPARDFMPHVEETELGRQVDCTALEIGLRHLSLAPDLRISINLSARSIGYGKGNDILGRSLRRDPDIGNRLILEITESSTILLPDLVLSFMKDLRKRGITFALDDFGAGTTSFRYLRDFNFDIVKIDEQFVRNVATDPDNQVLIQARISIAEHFGMHTVAEAVENIIDSNWLAAHGIDCLQGYYWGAPTMTPPWIQPQNSDMSS